MTSVAVTRSTPFHTLSGQPHLFAVQPAVSLQDALDAASCILASAMITVRSAAVEHDDETIFGAVFQLEAVKAVVDSAYVAPSLASCIASLEALLQEAERLATSESGKDTSVYKGRAAAFAQALDVMREVQS